MITIEPQLNNKGEPSGQLVIKATNPTTKAPLNFRRVGDNGFFIQPEGLISLLDSLKSQQAEINKLTKAYANGRTFTITLSQFGDKEEIKPELETPDPLA